MTKKNKLLAKGKPACKCCKLEYWKGNILTGFTIVQIKDNDRDNSFSIDIPLSEIPRLINVCNKIMKKDIK